MSWWRRVSFRNLRTGTKLFILCGLFIVSTAVAVYELTAEKQIAIQFAKKELIGSRYVETLRDIYAAILIRPPDAQSAASPNASGERHLQALVTAEAGAGKVLQTAELKKALAATLGELWSGKADGRNAQRLRSEALAKAQDLTSRIGDDSNLTLDPDLDTYYLQDAIVTKLPAFLGHLAEVQALSRGNVSESTESERSVRVLVLDGLLRSGLEGVRRNLVAAYRGNADGSLTRTVDPPFKDMVSSTGAFLDQFDAGVPAVKPIEISSIDRSYVSAVGRTIDVWAIAQHELDRLLKRRIDVLRAKLASSMTLVGALAALSILVAVMTHQFIARPLQRLEGLASKVRDTKNYSLRSDLSSDDEIGRLATAFNNMLSELASARRREMTEQAELARAARLTTMGVMTASIAHEISQPLAAIVASSNAALRWLGRASPNLDEVSSILKRVVSDGHRAGDVIGSVRAMFKNDSHERTWLDANDVVREVLAFARGELHHHDISVETELLPELPQVLTDRVQLQQVLLNLIMNAIEAMSAVTTGSRLLTVKSEISQTRDVLITVEDSGTGIEAKDIDRIFDAFFTTKSNGMGMGLSICRSIIEAHGGRLWASPAVPQGSIFHVVLPSDDAGDGR
jgi:signal transduction histidine kinase